MPPKNKKKGKHGDDSDDDDSAAVSATLAALNLTDKSDKPSKTGVKDIKVESKETKKGNKKGTRKGDNSDDESDQLSPMKKIADPIDSDEDKPNAKVSNKGKGPAPPPKLQSSKKDQKKGKRRDDSDDEDPLAKMKSLAEEDDDEDDSDSEDKKSKLPVKNSKGKEAPKPQPSTKKDQKKGKRRDDSDDEDPLAKMKSLAEEDDDEDDSDSEDKKSKLSVKNSKGKEAPKPQPSTKKDQKKGKRRDDSDDEDGHLPKTKFLEEGNGEDESDEVKSKSNQSKSTYSSIKSKNNIMKFGNEDESEEKDDKSYKSMQSLKSAKDDTINERKIEKQHDGVPVSEVSSFSSKPEEQQFPAYSELSKVEVKLPLLPQAVNPDDKPPPVPDSITAKASEAQVENKKSTAPSKEEPSEPLPNKPKTALQLKMEKVKKAKEERELAAKVAAEEEKKRLQIETEEKARADAAKKIEDERLRLEKIAHDEANKKLLDEQVAAAAAAVSQIEPTNSSSFLSPVKVADPVTVLSEEEKLARLQSAMYGDDVHNEYGNPVVQEEEAAAGGKSKKRDRQSNKARKRQAKEQESIDREEEARLAQIKASIEGAQFACSQSAINPDDPLWQNSLDINIPSLTISAHNKELFSNAELSIAHGRRYGLVGPNGAGKSTLLKMIAYGELKVPPRIDYLYVEQEVIADDTPAVDAVLKADKERWSLIQEEKEILKALEAGPNEALDSRLGEIYEDLANINASSAEPRARRILFGLGFDAEMQIRPTKYFSGGWRMRISLARALFIEPTLLMLDEPTNHLDLNAVIWLDDYLQRWKKTLLIVSHDQDFLNSVCQEIIHLNEKKLVVYKGNYDNFKEQEAVKRQQQQEAWEKQEKKIRQLKSKGITKENAEKEQLRQRTREPGARSQRKADAAAVSSGGVESGENQAELIKRPKDYLVKFYFPEVNLINPPILQIRDVSFRYGPNLPLLFKNLSFGLDMSSRVCIVGPNGSGKSTLLKLITGELNPPEGMVIRNPRLRVGVYNQHFVDRLPMEEDPVSYLRRLFNEESYQSTRNLLGRFGLEGHAHTIRNRDLSGGQKARVVFTELSLMAPHILFLDEPTNNLDIESIDALCEAIRDYNGGVVLVSHDARLIETTNCQLWVVEDQTVTPWEKGFNHYREHLLQKLEDQLALIMPGSGERPGEKQSK